MGMFGSCIRWLWIQIIEGRESGVRWLPTWKKRLGSVAVIPYGWELMMKMTKHHFQGSISIRIR